MMVKDGTILARALSDGEDRLLSADAPLSGLQLRCGGELPGTIAIPELLELVSKARRYGFRVARAVSAQDGAETVTAWVEVEPLGEAEGCNICVRSWHAVPIPAEDSTSAESRRMLTARHLAELSAQLDARQRVLAVVSDSEELAEAAAALEEGIGRLWTDILSLKDVAHQQPLHWRLMDGASVTVPGAQRAWRVTLIPHMQPGFDPVGFELLLLSDEAASDRLDILPVQAAPLVPARRSLVGQDIAPVLKQPISRIIANAETIRTRLAGPLPDAYSDYAGEIASAGKLLIELLDDMADLEVVVSEGFSTAPDRIDLSEVARQAAGILGVRAREKG
ncbi:MAG: sensor histidine kinase, partial [Novosphingobium sp.]